MCSSRVVKLTFMNEHLWFAKLFCEHVLHYILHVYLVSYLLFQIILLKLWPNNANEVKMLMLNN